MRWARHVATQYRQCTYKRDIERVMGWAGFVARMRTTKMRAEVWLGGLEDHLEDLGVDGTIILKCILNK
jgi:hypothetical protein